MRSYPNPLLRRTALAAAATLALSAPLAFAASPAPQDSPAQAKTEVPTAVAAEDATRAEAEVPTAVAEDTTIIRRQCLQNTGSMITAARNKRAQREGKPLECAPVFGRTYTNEDLRSTGGVDLADMLRTLDPSIR